MPLLTELDGLFSPVVSINMALLTELTNRRHQKPIFPAVDSGFPVKFNAFPAPACSHPRMLPRLAVSAMKMFGGLGVTHNRALLRVINNWAAQVHGDIGEDAACG